jgi:hypothetical protein
MVRRFHTQHGPAVFQWCEAQANIEAPRRICGAATNRCRIDARSAIEEGRGDGNEALGKRETRRVRQTGLRLPDLDQAGVGGSEKPQFARRSTRVNDRIGIEPSG